MGNFKKKGNFWTIFPNFWGFFPKNQKQRLAQR